MSQEPDSVDVVVPPGAEDDHDAADRGAALAEQVLRAARELHLHEVAVADALVLNPTCAQVMQHVDAHPGSTPSEIADATGLQRSNVSTALRELGELGFVVRERDPADRRVVRIRSTVLALENRRTIRAQWADTVSRLLDDDDLDRALPVLRRLVDGLVAGRRG